MCNKKANDTLSKHKSKKLKTIKNILNVGFVLVFVLFTFGVSAQRAPFALAPLPYAFNGLEPVIDAQTVEIHYSKHHVNYMKSLNTSLKDSKFAELSLEDLMLNAGEEGDAIRNNAGGFYNHTLY